MKTLVSNQSNWPKSGWVSNQNYHFNCWRLETCTEKQWNLIIPSEFAISTFSHLSENQVSRTLNLRPCILSNNYQACLVIYIARFHTTLFLWTTFIHPASQNHEVGKKALLLDIRPTFIHFPVFHWRWLEDTGINLDPPHCFLPLNSLFQPHEDDFGTLSNANRAGCCQYMMISQLLWGDKNPSRATRWFHVSFVPSRSGWNVSLCRSSKAARRKATSALPWPQVAAMETNRGDDSFKIAGPVS